MARSPYLFQGKYHKALDTHSVPRHDDKGNRLTYEQRVQWLANKANPQATPALQGSPS